MKKQLWFVVLTFLFFNVTLSNAQSCGMYTYHNVVFDGDGNAIGHNVTQLGNCTGNEVDAYVYVKMPSGYGAGASNSGTTYAEAVAPASMSGEIGQGFISGNNTVSFKCWEPVLVSFLPVPFPIPLPSVTVVAKTQSSDVIAGDFAKEQYTSYTNSTQLGSHAGPLGPQPTNEKGCVIGTELVGTVLPSTWKGLVILHREVVSQGCWRGSEHITDAHCPPPGNDTGVWLDPNPQASGGPKGVVYNADAPGPVFEDNIPSVSPLRIRVNFQAWAVDATGNILSPKISYFVRVSCSQDATGAHLVTEQGISDDNRGGDGTTPVSFDLK